MKKQFVVIGVVLAGLSLPACKPHDEVKIPTITSTQDTTQTPTGDPTRPRIHPPKEGDH